jgi:signal transduction histidine kinase
MAGRADPAEPQLRRRTLNPATWPVRWRLAMVSAALTLAILLVFAGVVGRLAGDRIRSDFDRDLTNAAQSFAEQLHIVDSPLGPQLARDVGVNDFVLPRDASLRVFADTGEVLLPVRAGGLGPVGAGIRNSGELRVTTVPVTELNSGTPSGVLQYGRSTANMESTIARLWLLLGLGVFGGTLLASLAGLAIASRAMRPIGSLTATAREIAATSDPSRSMPPPTSDDEVGELTRTLEQMLRSLDSARTEREQAMRRQREFVADASHELRTPLTSVIANLELLAESLPDPGQSEEREVVDSALRSSHRMSRLVADLLLLARADAGRVGERRRCDLAEIAGNAATEVAAIARDHELVVRDGQSMAVLGNPDELHRMVLNLLENAVRHTPGGTDVELRMRRDDELGVAVVEVADDGPGIPAEVREQIFDRFVRGGGPTDTAGGGGTGLGLAIVRAVARSHGGDVELAASESGGACFRVSLPLARSEEPISVALEPL